MPMISLPLFHTSAADKERKGWMMAEKIIIYGKSGWPYTSNARSAYGDEAVYVDVKADKNNLDEMLKHSGGVREVPVIVKGGKVTIGYDGTWGVWCVTVGDFQPNIFEIPFNFEWTLIIVSTPRVMWVFRGSVFSAASGRQNGRFDRSGNFVNLGIGCHEIQAFRGTIKSSIGRVFQPCLP
jgi:glutaredoxin